MMTSAVKFSELKPSIKISCALSPSCHSAKSDLGNGMRLDLETDPYTAMVNAVTLEVPNFPKVKADFPTLVVPKDAAKSAVYMKLTLPLANDPSYGSRMPQSTAADVALAAKFKSWIDNGALND